MIIAVEIIIFVSMVYLNRKIPGREFRSSNDMLAIGLFISIGAGILGAEIRRQNMKIK